MIKKLLLSLLISAFLVTPAFAGASRDFDGTDDYITSTVTGASTTNTVTVTAWVSWDATKIYDSIIETRGGGLFVGFLLGSPNKTLNYSWENTGDEYNVDSGLLPTFGPWYFVAMAVSPTATTVYMSAAGGGTFTTWTNTKTHNAKDIYESWHIGEDPGNGRYSDGRIAYVHLYDRTLSAAELTQVMWKPLSVTNNLLFHLPLWGVNSPEVDLSGNGYVGTVFGPTESSGGPPVMLGGGRFYSRVSGVISPTVLQGMTLQGATIN